MSIEAMKQALEALEEQLADFPLEVHRLLPRITFLRQAIAEAEKQEQGEPVAWWVTSPDGELDDSDGPIKSKEERPLNELVDGCGYAPLYTTPQQRKPLDEPLVGALLYLFQEWKEDHLSQSNYIDCIEGIKAAHGIKG